MQHRREGTFVRVLGNVVTVRTHQCAVKWLQGFCNIGALSCMVLPVRDWAEPWSIQDGSSLDMTSDGS